MARQATPRSLIVGRGSIQDDCEIGSATTITVAPSVTQ